MPEKFHLPDVFSFIILLMVCMVSEAFSQPKKWHVADLEGNLKFSVLADTILVLDSQWYSVEIRGESIVFRENPFQPVFRSKDIRFEPADNRFVWQKSRTGSHLAFRKNPLSISYKQVNGMAVWNEKSLIRQQDKWIYRPGEPEELVADSFKTGKRRLYLFVPQGIIEIDSLFSVRFFAVNGKEKILNPNETHFAGDSIWHPFSSGFQAVQQKPGFWWNDSLFAEKSAGGWKIMGSRKPKSEKADSAWFISPHFLAIKNRNQNMVLSHRGKKIKLGQKPEFQMVSDTLLAVKSGDTRLFIGPSGSKTKVNRTISEIGKEREGLFLVKAGKRFGFADAGGFIRIACRYDSLLPFHNGRSAVKLGNFWGYLDKDERLVVQPNFVQAENFTSTLAPVKKQGKWGLIDVNGQMVLAPEFDSITIFHSDFFLVRKNGWAGLADRKGQMVLQNRFFSIIEASKGLIMIGRDGKYGLNTLSGKSVIELNFRKIEVLNHEKRLIYY